MQVCLSAHRQGWWDLSSATPFESEYAVGIEKYEGVMDSLQHDEIREMHEKLKAIFCPQCKHYKGAKPCRYMALCFAGFILDGVRPPYFFPKEGENK